MRTTALHSALGLLLVLALAACGERGTAGSPGNGTEGGTTSTAADGSNVPGTAVPATSGLVLRVEYTGGFLPAARLAARVPVVSVYADGQVISEGPVAAVHPGSAWPNLQVTHVDEDAMRALVDGALRAGVGNATDLGSPPLADAPATRFTVVTTSGTHVSEVYALSGSDQTDSGLSPEQQQARGRLNDLLGTLTAASRDGSAAEAFGPQTVAVLAGPWVDPGDGLGGDPRPWPGPALPGEPAGPLGLTCVTASGTEAMALRDATRSATVSTPWTTPDGARWSVLFRPLLPDETGCADLAS